MATWNDVMNHIKANFKYEIIAEGLVKLQFDMGGGRSQLVFISRVGNEKIGEWAGVASPVGGIDKVKKLEAYCRAVNDWVCGGIVIFADYIMLRDTFPLENLDVNEFNLPLLTIVDAADEIERTITGGDAY